MQILPAVNNFSGFNLCYEASTWIFNYEPESSWAQKIKGVGKRKIAIDNNITWSQNYTKYAITLNIYF